MALTTSPTLASVAPCAPSMPIERSRRCASTVNPPTATSAISSIPSVAAASEMVTGLSTFALATDARDTTAWLSARGIVPRASNRTVT